MTARFQSSLAPYLDNFVQWIPCRITSSLLKQRSENHSPNLVRSLCLYGPWLKNCFYFFEQLRKKNQKKSISWCENHMKFKFQCPQMNFYWNMAHSVIDVLSVVALAWQQQNKYCHREMSGLQDQKYSLSGPLLLVSLLTEVCWPLV